MTALDTNAINELLSRSPLTLSDDELRELIAYFRQVREKVLAAEKAGKPRRGAKLPIPGEEAI